MGLLEKLFGKRETAGDAPTNAPPPGAKAKK